MVNSPSLSARISSALASAAPLLHAQNAFDTANNLSVAEQYLLAAANEARAKQGLHPSASTPSSAKPPPSTPARWPTTPISPINSMANQNSPTRGANAGAHFSLIAENVGEAPSSVIIHDLWMHSPGHRANLLDPDVDSIGIAIVIRDNQLYAVEDFASTVQILTLNQQERTVAGVIAQSGIQRRRNHPEARQTCTMTTGYAGSRQPWYIMRYTAASLNEIPSQLKSRLRPANIIRP